MRVPSLLLALGLSLGGAAIAGATLLDLSDDEPIDPLEHLARYEGQWATHTPFWMVPDGDPIEWDGTAEARLVGSFLLTEHHAELEMFGREMEFEGVDLSGYDALKGCWVSTWVDNQSTWLTHSEGGINDAGDLVKRANMHDPALGEDVPTDMIDHWISDDEWTMTMSQPQEQGEPIVSMQITMRRVIAE